MMDANRIRAASEVQAIQGVNMYDAGRWLAEIYDSLTEDENGDVACLEGLVRSISGREDPPLCILEPFCGTGRLTLPLASMGHVLTGMDISPDMLERFECKRIQAGLPEKSVRLFACNVLDAEWAGPYDVVVLGCNCLYELGTPDDQATCIRKAWDALSPGGCLYLDGDHMEGDLPLSWQQTGVVETAMEGSTEDGSLVRATRETIWFDAPKRLARFLRRTTVRMADGTVRAYECTQQKHPVSAREVESWLSECGFAVLGRYGDWCQAPFSFDGPRMVFWAQKPLQTALSRLPHQWVRMTLNS